MNQPYPAQERPGASTIVGPEDFARVSTRASRQARRWEAERALLRYQEELIRRGRLV